MKAGRVTVSSSKRGTTVKATGKAAQALFDALAGPQPQLVPKAGTPYRIEFEDHGQDFLVWHVDATGKVTDCEPQQAWVWVGVQVLAEPKPGERVRVRTVAGTEATVNHPVFRIKRTHTPPPAVATGGTGG